MSIAEIFAALKDGTDEAKANAALKLRRMLSGAPPSRRTREIFEAGGVPLLVDLLESGSVSAYGKCHAAHVLGYLMLGDANDPKDLIGPVIHAIKPLLKRKA